MRSLNQYTTTKTDQSTERPSDNMDNQRIDQYVEDINDVEETNHEDTREQQSL